MASSHRIVLVTGSAGRLGRAAVTGLAAAGWTVRGFDRCPSPLAHESHVADLTQSDAIQRAATGASALIHLAATPDDDDFSSRLLPDNIIGLYNVMEAARLAGVSRVILASTGQLNWWQQRDGPLPVHPSHRITPKRWYAVTKVAAEAAGQVYAHDHGITVLAVRLGWCPRTREQVEEISQSQIGQDTYLSPGDAGRFFARAVEAPVPTGYHVVFAASRPVQQVIFDLKPTRDLLGWSPEDQWPTSADPSLSR